MTGIKKGDTVWVSISKDELIEVLLVADDKMGYIGPTKVMEVKEKRCLLRFPMSVGISSEWYVFNWMIKHKVEV